MAKRTTKKEYFNILRGIVETSPDVDVAEMTALLTFIDNELELLDKKRGGSKESKTANAKAEKLVLEVLKDYEKVTVTELMADTRLATFTDKDGNAVPMSNQRLASFLRRLVADGSVTKETAEKGKKSLFSLAVV